MKKRLFSGCTPTGILTLGNYLGAMRYWKEDQENYDALFTVADQHALTVPRDPALIRERSLDFLCLYMACGVDPEKSTLFVQSHNPRHSELAWVLDCLVSVGELNRMTQFKAKAALAGKAGGGLFTYPVLMAADILLYGAELVPAGDDQKQHLELTRRLGTRLNRRYGTGLPLPVPRPRSEPGTGRIANLLDPSRKMDKSHRNGDTYIGLTDSPEEIARKISRARTDGKGDFDLEDRTSGIGNLVGIYSALTGLGAGTVVWEYEHRGYGRFKKDLAEVITESLAPVRKEFFRLREEGGYLRRCLAMGKEKALAKSEENYRSIREAVGFISCP